ncbi:MAG: type II CAAX endopeptidase family protein [Candidatus Saccharimonadales bacterium]
MQDYDMKEEGQEKELIEKPAVKWKALPALFIAALAIIGSQIVGLFGVAAYILLVDGVSFSTAIINAEEQLIYYFSSYLIAEVLAVTAVYLYVRNKGGSWLDLGFRSFNWLKAVGWIGVFTIGFLVLASVAVGIGEVLLPGVDFDQEQEISFLAARDSLEMILAFLALVVIAPISEETIFRGFLLPAFTKSIGVIWAVIMTSALFGLLHPPIGAMIVISLFAVFLALAYIRLNSIWPAIILHSGKNLVAFMLIFGVI